MKVKEIYIGQEVARAGTPKIRLGTVVGIMKKMVDIKLGTGEHVAVYGAKVLVKYVESRNG